MSICTKCDDVIKNRCPAGQHDERSTPKHRTQHLALQPPSSLYLALAFQSPPLLRKLVGHSSYSASPQTSRPSRKFVHAPSACRIRLVEMAIMDYIQSGVEKVLKPKRGGLGGMGGGIGSSTGVAQFQDGVRVSSLAICCFPAASLRILCAFGPQIAPNYSFEMPFPLTFSGHDHKVGLVSVVAQPTAPAGRPTALAITGDAWRWFDFRDALSPFHFNPLPIYPRSSSALCLFSCMHECNGVRACADNSLCCS